MTFTRPTDRRCPSCPLAPTVTIKPAAAPVPCCGRRDIHKIDRPPLHLAMYERIVTGGHRTADGENADFYFVPITSR